MAIGWQAAGAPWIVALCLAVVGGVMTPLSAWMYMLIVDSLSKRPVHTATVVLLAVLASSAGAASLVLSYVSSLAGLAANRKIELVVTDRVYAAVNRFTGLRRIEDPQFHDRLLLAEQAAQEGPQGLSSVSLIVVRGVATIGGFAGALITVWPPMIVLLIGAMVPMVLAQRAASKEQASVAESTSRLYRHRLIFRGVLTDARSAQEVRLLGLGDLFRNRMIAAIGDASQAEYGSVRRTTLAQVWLAVFNGLVVAAGMGVVAYQAARGRIMLGDFVLFFTAVIGVQGVTSSLMVQLTRLGRSLRLFRHFLDLMDERDEIATGTLAVPPLRGGIEVRDVWFRYDPDGQWALRGVNLQIAAGQAIGLVGLNGAGKTTLIKLLCRFYEPERGQILWDGVDVRGFDVTELRRRLAVTFQDFMIYDLSAAENIGLGDLSRLDDRDAISRSAGLAGLGQTLGALPRGYDTLLSRTLYDGAGDAAGARLSGGQSQRLALARSLMRDDAELMILDEPSSGLDAEAEQEIHRSLQSHRGSRTCLLVSHRLSAVREADVIAVLAAGEITELGTHDQLMAAGDGYARLFALQASGYQDDRVLGGAVGQCPAVPCATAPGAPLAATALAPAPLAPAPLAPGPYATASHSAVPRS
jgi:ATP-binding cassette, subfamily B, bacterial